MPDNDLICKKVREGRREAVPVLPSTRWLDAVGLQGDLLKLSRNRRRVTGYALSIAARLRTLAPANLRRRVAFGRRIRPVVFLATEIERDRIVGIAPHEIIEDRP